MNLLINIKRISDEQDSEAVWDIIQLFLPLIRRECYNSATKRVDEDMVSEIITKLPDRLIRFKIIEDICDERN